MESRKQAIAIVRELGLKPDKEEFFELVDNVDSKIDFILEIGGTEFRAIHGDHIRGIYQEEFEEMFKDCYLSGIELPWWVSIDMEETAQTCLDADGYGQHFNIWDGSEEEAGDWHLFKLSA